MNRFDAGEVHYCSVRGGQNYTGHAIGTTEVIDPGGGNRMWHVRRAALGDNFQGLAQLP